MKQAIETLIPYFDSNIIPKDYNLRDGLTVTAEDPILPDTVHCIAFEYRGTRVVLRVSSTGLTVHRSKIDDYAITNMGQGQQQGNPLQFAQQLAQLEAQMLQMKTQQELQITEAKAKQDMAIKDAETKQKLAIDQAELNQDLQAKMAKLQLELQIIRDKYQAKQGG